MKEEFEMKPMKRAAADYGIAVRGGTLRGVAATTDGRGHDAVVVWLMDDVNRRVLQIDAETGACDGIPVPFDNPDAVYSSLRSRSGKCYSLFGNHFVEYDPARKEFTFVRSVPSLAAMAMEEDGEGRIWAAAYPDCALYSFAPAERRFTDHGVLNRENWPQYPRTLAAAPDGWLYIGIGETAGHLIAYHRETGEIRPLLTEDERIRPAMCQVYGDGGGGIYGGIRGDAGPFYKLSGGAKSPCGEPDVKMHYPDYTGPQDAVLRGFPSGRTLTGIDLAAGTLEVLEKDGKSRRTVSFTFENYGAPLMGLDVNADGVMAGGGFFPFRFGTLDPAAGRRTDEAAGIQCNTILARGKYFYIGGYCGGQILRYDPSRPWTLKNPMELEEPDFDANPIFYGKADPAINRPHCLAITPDGKTLAMGGTPGYGMTGGGLALLDMDSGRLRVIPHTELAENEAPFALAALSDRLLLVGTTTAPGTGGERKAPEAGLLLVDAAGGRTVWRGRVPGGIDAVLSLAALPGGDAVGIDSDLRLFRFELASRRIIPGASVREFGGLPVTQGPRLLLHDSDDLWLLFRSGVGRVDPDKCAVTGFIPVTPEIQAGGAVRGGVLYYGSDRRWRGVSLTGAAQ